MTSPADPWIDALRRSHDHLASFVEGLSDDQLHQSSTAEGWDVSQVLSHLGSSAEINLAGLRAQLDGADDTTDNQSVWDRWDGSSPAERAKNFLVADHDLLATYEGLDDATRNSFQVSLSYLPAPIGLDAAVAMRLSEHALHSWDVFSTFDPAATLDGPSADLLSGHPSPFIKYQANGGWTGESGVIEISTSAPERVLSLTVGDDLVLVEAAATDPIGRVVLPAEAWVRLLSGRLDAGHTPAGVTSDPADLLDRLRTLFGGY